MQAELSFKEQLQEESCASDRWVEAQLLRGLRCSPSAPFGTPSIAAREPLQFVGKAMDVGQWFTLLNLPPPRNINLADFVLDIASGEIPTTSEEGGETRKRCLLAAEAYLKKNPQGYGTDTELSAPEVIMAFVQKFNG